MGKFICNRNGVANPMNYHQMLVKGDVFECDPHSLHMEDLLNGIFSVYREPEPVVESAPELTSAQVVEHVTQVVSDTVEGIAHPIPVIDDGVSPEAKDNERWRKRFGR